MFSALTTASETGTAKLLFGDATTEDTTEPALEVLDKEVERAACKSGKGAVLLERYVSYKDLETKKIIKN